MRKVKPREIRISELVQATERQKEFWRAVATHKYTLYGGAAGGGKSYILRWTLLILMLQWAQRGIKNVRTGLFSEDYPTLRDRQINKIDTEFPKWLGEVHETQISGLGFFVKPEYGGGAMLLRNLDDPSKYKSSEFAAIGVEELSHNEEQVFNDLRFRMRWPGISDPKFMGATNPGNIGHSWIKRLWIARDFPEELKAEAHEFEYVPAKATDNPHIDPSYLKQLDSLPQAMRVMVRDGSWDVFQGMKFEEWRREVHTCDPFTIPYWWSKWLSNDPGFTDPGVWHLLACDQDGQVYCIKEWSFYSVPYSQQAKQVHDDLKTDEESQAAIEKRKPKEFYSVCVTGMDAFAKHKETGKSYVDYYNAGGIYACVPPVDRASPGSRKTRAGIMHEYLRIYPGPDGKPTAKLKIFRTCKKLIEILPSCVSDDLVPEQVAKFDGLHWYDSATYGIAYHHGDGVKPKETYKPEQLGALLGHDMVIANMLKGDDDEYD